MPPDGERPLEQLVLTAQVAERSHVRESERKTELILIAHRTQREPPIFHAEAAAVPVVARLERAVLQEVRRHVEADRCGRTQTTFAWAAVTGEHSELVELHRCRHRRGHEDLTWRVEECVAPAEEPIAEFQV